MEPQLEAWICETFAAKLFLNSHIENPNENIEQGIYWCRRALRIRTQESYPYSEELALMLSILGYNLQNRISGDRQKNSDEAIECYRRALETWTRETFPQHWASIKVKIGNALQNGSCGDRKEVFDEAIECYRQALEIWTRESFPQEWATTHKIMGDVYLDRISGNRRVNLDQAIECYRQALKIWTRESMTQDWARAQANMGKALKNRISGNRRVNLDEAIKCYKLVLEIWTEESNPEDWATVKMNMGNALRNRISGDRQRNIEEAIECYQEALKTRTQDSMPIEWAKIQVNMGNALLNRIFEAPETNVDNAIECYQQALKIWTRESFPGDWAKTQVNMGNALQQQISGDTETNIDEAIKCYRRTLKIWKRESFPHLWGRTHLNMGNTYLDRISGDRIGNTQESIECCRLALEVLTRESFPLEWALSHLNVGKAYLSYVAAEQTSNLLNAKHAIEKFFEVVSMEMDPLTFLKGCRLHTQLYLRIGSVPEIIASCEQGLRVVEYTKSLSSAGLLYSRHLDEKNAFFANNLMSMHFHEERYEKVLEVFDRNKASVLLRLISKWDYTRSKLLEEDRMKLEELKAEYRQMKYELDFKQEKGEISEEVSAEFRRIKTNIDTLINIQNQHQRQGILGVSCEEMNEFVKKKNVIAIVFFFAGEYEKLKEGEESKSLHAICMWNGRVIGYMEDKELTYEVSYETAIMFSDDRILPFENREESLKRRKNEKELLQNLGKFISSILDDLKTHSPGSDLPNRLLIVPHYILNKAPFCAVPVRTGFDGYRGEEPRFLGDMFRGGIWIVPNMSIAVRIDRKKEGKNAKKLQDCKVVSATCPSLLLQEHYTKTVKEEIGRNVRSHVHISDPYPPRTKIKTSEDMRDCDILHITCHGVFAGGRDVFCALRKPSGVLSESALLFESCERRIVSEEEKKLKELNMEDIWELNLKECSLANVVACSGGAVNTLSESDESLSIGTGFLVGGARNVICCAWPVQEIVAAIMMGRLLENMCKSGNGENGVWKIGEHLGEVQRWFRELEFKEFYDLWERHDPENKTGGLGDIDNFYHWGAFMLVGPPD